MDASRVWLAELVALIAQESELAAGPEVGLASEPFLPRELSSPGPAEPDFPGYARIVLPAGSQETYIRPADGAMVLALRPPAGGWHWEAAGDPDEPQTLYGIVLWVAGSSTPLAGELLPGAVTITRAGEGYSAGPLEFVLFPP